MESSESQNSNIDRKFLHDLSGPLTVVKIMSDRIRADLEAPASKYTNKQYLEWMIKIGAAIQSIEVHLAKKKAEVLKSEETNRVING